MSGQPDFKHNASLRQGGDNQPMKKVLMAVGAIAIAGLSAAIGWYGIKWLTAPDADQVATPTATPGAPTPTIPVTFNLAEVEAQAAGLFTPPRCGETWSADSAAAHGIIPEVAVTTGATRASATMSFANTNEVLTAFLAQEGQLIITRDDVVVTPDWGAEFVPELFVTTPQASAPASDVFQFTGATLCDTAAELSAIWDDFDWANATEAQIAQRQQQAADFEAEHASLPPGEYKVYAWTPVILGEPAAAARALVEEGFTDIAHLQYNAGYSPLRDDPRIQDHCEVTQNPDGQTEMPCNVPQDVLTEVLARDVPPHYVVEDEAALAISEPATFIVE